MLLVALASAGCVSFSFDRATVNLPPRKEALATLAPGTTTLTDALAALGAPILAWEWKGDGMALAWGWSHDAARGVTISIPIDQGNSASASYDDLTKHLRGVVLFFDADAKLVHVREGALNDFQAERARPRPAAVDASPPN